MRRWFGPYAVTSVNDNGTYHLAELDGTRLVVSIVRKRIKAFKKQHEDELERGSVGDSDAQFELGDDSESEK